MARSVGPDGLAQPGVQHMSGTQGISCVDERIAGLSIGFVRQLRRLSWESGGLRQQLPQHVALSSVEIVLFGGREGNLRVSLARACSESADRLS